MPEVIAGSDENKLACNYVCNHSVDTVIERLQISINTIYKQGLSLFQTDPKLI